MNDVLTISASDPGLGEDETWREAVGATRPRRTRTRPKGKRNALPTFHSDLVGAKQAETRLTFCLSEETDYTDDDGCFDAIILVVDTYAIKVHIYQAGKLSPLMVWIGKRFIVSVTIP